MGRDFTGDTIQKSMSVMKASELRLGNWVECLSSTQQVQGVKMYGDCSEVDLTAIHWIDDVDIKPIPLTEEWLLKFGFETKDKVFWDVGNFRVGQDRWGGYDYVSRRVDIDLKYVHQLQNLYFALTGEELTIKE